MAEQLFKMEGRCRGPDKADSMCWDNLMGVYGAVYIGWWNAELTMSLTCHMMYDTGLWIINDFLLVHTFYWMFYLTYIHENER